MSSIDERIVSMQFDNDQFEKGVGTTLKSLTNLEKSVDGLNGLNTNPLLNTLDTVSDRFSSLGIVGMTVIQNLTNRFVDMGVNMAKSLTIDQVSAGFAKYTENTKTVKALLNSTGETIDVVTEKINGLSWYSDATSYSYNAMVSALKSFTAQDIKMDEAIPAIMGIGNSLSYAGLAAESASGAFDIYSKAMGQGYLSNIQLKSLNNMGAVTAQWKQQMLDAAVAEGTLKKVGDGLYRTNQGLNVSIKEFDMTLGHQKGKWLTREVMMRVFGQVYGDYTQRLQAFMAEEENAGLTIDQAINKFNELNGITEDFGLKAFKSAQEARTFSEAVGAVKDAASSAWRGIFENVFGNADEATEMWTAFSDWLYDVFMGPSEMMFNLTTEWKRLGGREGMLQGFANLAEALHSITTPIQQAFHAVFGELNASTLGAALKDLTDKFVTFTEKLKLDTPTFVKLRQIAEGFFSLLSIGKTILEDIGSAAGQVFEHFKPLGGKLLDTAASIGKYITEHRALANMFIKENGLVSGLTAFVLKLAETVENAKPLEWLFEKITSLASTLWQKLKEVGEQFKKTFNPIMDGQISFENILKLIATLGGAAALKVTVFDRLKNLGSLPKDFGKGISTVIKTVADSMREWTMVDISASQMKSIAVALAIMAGSLFVIASINPERLMSGLLGITALVKIMEGVVSKFASLAINPKAGLGMSQAASAMIKIGAAVLILSFAVKQLSGLNLEELVKGLGGMAAILLAISMFANSMKDVKLKPSTGMAVILIATGILIMAKGVEALGSIPIDQLKQGLLSIAAILAGISAFSRLVKPEGILKTSFSMVVLGGAILIMAKGIEVMGTMPFETVMQGLVGIAAGLTVFGIALKLIPSNMGAAVSVGIMATSMIALALAFKILGSVPLEGIGKGLLAILPTLGAVFLMFKFLQPGQSIAVAAAFAIFAAALSLLVPPFLLLGNMKLSSIGKALLAIGGSLAIFGLAATLLSAAVVPMLGLASAMLLFGLGVSAFAAGIASLAVSGVAATASFIGSIELWLTAIPLMATGLVKAFTALLQALLQAVVVAIPQLLDTLGFVIEKVLEFLLAKLPIYTALGGQVVVAFLNGLAEQMPAMVESAINFIAVFISSLADSLETHKEQLIEGIDKLIINIFDLVVGAIVGLLKLIWDRAPELFHTAVEFFAEFLAGIAEKGKEIGEKIHEIIAKIGEAIEEKWEQLKAWGAELWTKVKEGFTSAIDNVVSGAKSLGRAILQGLGIGMSDETEIEKTKQQGRSATRGVLNAMKEEADSHSPSKVTEELGKNIMQGLSIGIEENDYLPIESASSSTSSVLSALASSSSESEGVGESLMSGLATGIDENAFVAEDAAEEAGDNVTNAFDAKIQKMIEDLENEIKMDPTITPVIDMTKFDAGLAEIKESLEEVKQDAQVFSSYEEYYNSLSPERKKLEDGWNQNRNVLNRGLGWRALDYNAANLVADDVNHRMVKYGKNTIDLAHAAAAGLLDAEGREMWEKYATEEDKKIYQVIVNQKNTSPKALDADEIYRQTNNAVRDVVAMVQAT